MIHYCNKKIISFHSLPGRKTHTQYRFQHESSFYASSLLSLTAVLEASTRGHNYLEALN